MPAPSFTGWLNLTVHSRNSLRQRPLACALITSAALAGAAALVSTPAPAQAASTEGPQAAFMARATAPPSVSVSGADLVDASTGAVLWDKDVNTPRPMGSITKVMAALVVLKGGDLGRQIKVTEGAVRYVKKDGASSAGLIAGDVLTARQLLEAMLLPSGCDAAYMLATAYGPGRTAFIAKMNAMAASMGLKETHFSWFDGMPYPTEHSTYSSPADLVRIGERAMRNSTFRSIVAQRSYYLPATHLHHKYRWHTTDMLLGSYPGAIGIKTGDTKAAGNCLLFEARRDGRTLIGVVLHANPTSNGASAFPAAETLLDWGFSQP
jgi:serine-type D-Ala-D-Ala carboxypeptidase (penicillin-binding protein 5/6)